MLNSFAAYTDCGKKAAIAMNQKDMARYKFHREWFTRAILLEKIEIRNAVRSAYERGYEEARVIPSATYFR